MKVKELLAEAKKVNDSADEFRRQKAILEGKIYEIAKESSVLVEQAQKMCPHPSWVQTSFFTDWAYATEHTPRDYTCTLCKMTMERSPYSMKMENCRIEK